MLCERTFSFLEGVGTPEEYLAPRRKAFDRWRRVVRSLTTGKPGDVNAAPRTDSGQTRDEPV
jgi:hypothetical protein